MISISNMNVMGGRVAATFTAKVGDLALPGCALIRREGGYTLSVPRIGTPSRPAPLTAVQLAELERVAVMSIGIEDSSNEPEPDTENSDTQVYNDESQNRRSF